MSSRSLPVSRLITELLVIILGVLIALGAEAWWSGRIEAAAEREYLVLARVELEDLSVHLRDRIDDLTGDLAAFEAEFARLESADPDDPYDFNLSVTTVRPRLGLLREINEIGGPILDREPAVRAEVGSLVSEIETDHALANLFLAQQIENIRTMSTIYWELNLEREGPVTFSQVRGSPEAIGALAFSQLAVRQVVRQFDRMLLVCQTTIELLDAVLREHGIVVEDDVGAVPDSLGVMRDSVEQRSREGTRSPTGRGRSW